jgi:hypothetical protein
MQIGDGVQAHEIELPPHVRLASAPHELVLHVVPPKKVETTEPAEGEGEGEAAAPAPAADGDAPKK